MSFIRNKNAFFWIMTFPIFIYIVFYSIFGAMYDETYALFLLTGILGMTLTADGLFGIGALVKMYYQNGTIRMMRKMPMNIVSYFMGLIITRFAIMIVLYVLLNIACYLLSGMYMPLFSMPEILLGMFIGLWMFSFLGLCLAFLNIKTNAERGVVNIVYFLIIFTSNTFYNISAFNEGASKISAWLPLNGVLDVLREASFDWLNIAIWMAIPATVFYFLFNKFQYAR